MPRGNRRGPEGMGPRSGRGGGYCGGHDGPGYLNDTLAARGGRGAGHGDCHGGRGQGMGWRHGLGLGWRHHGTGSADEVETDIEQLEHRVALLRDELDATERHLSVLRGRAAGASTPEA